MDRNKIEDAITCYGPHIVNNVLEIVNISDPDGAYTLFEDQGMWDHADCIEMIFFE